MLLKCHSDSGGWDARELMTQWLVLCHICNAGSSM